MPTYQISIVAKDGALAGYYDAEIVTMDIVVNVRPDALTNVEKMATNMLDAMKVTGFMRVASVRELTEPEPEPEGFWQCGVGHLFSYEPPPAWPPWCGHAGCHAGGGFRWIIKDEVTAADWPR